MLEAIKNFLEQKTSQDQFSGAVLLAKNGKTILSYASGMANAEKNISNTLDTKFNLGSATKMFTGVAIAQLVEKKLLTFETLVGDVLPDYPNQFIKQQVSIHHLLTHTSGLGSFIDLEFRDQYLAARNSLDTIQKVVNLFKDRSLTFPTGELHYSSDGYEVLGLIIEKLSRLSYFDYIQKNIYDVASMPNSGSFGSDVAVGYTNRQSVDRVSNQDVNFLNGTAGGSSFSNCQDLLNFTTTLLSNKLLSPEMTALVLSPKIKEGSKGNQTKYEGYGFQIFDIDGVKRIGHPGRFSGLNTRIDMYPELGYTVIVLSNYDPPSAFDVAEKAGELIIKSLV